MTVVYSVPAGEWPYSNFADMEGDTAEDAVEHYPPARGRLCPG